ncbi:MAG: hypothetical protein HKN04_14615 [Rhodothermaceae bacterium]|nr:hypothetical protein [Rhodothermaceae bacterium]
MTHSVPPTPARQVVINGQPLDDEHLRALDALSGTPILDGRYWYDHACGAWGMEGGPVLGFIVPGLDLPGPMPPDCSGGGTGTWINGRELHPQDRTALIQLFGACYPGRFWLDAQGNLGPEGGPPLANVLLAARQAQAGSGGGLVSDAGGTVGVDGSGGIGFFSRNADGSFTSWTN